MKKKFLLLLILGLAGIFAGVALSVGETTGTVTATATACVPDRTFTGPSHTISRDGQQVYSSPGDVVTAPGACKTVENVQTYTIPTVTQTVTVGTTTTPAPAPYVSQSFESNPTSPWLYEASAPQGGTPAGSYSLVSDGVSGKAVRYHTPASSTGDVHQGQLVSHYLGNGSGLLHDTEGATTWYRVHFRAPSGTNFLGGQWDWLVEWHNNTNTVPGTVSMAWDLLSNSVASVTAPASNPYLGFRAAGGPHTAPVYTWYKMPSGSLVPGHWYDLVAQITWGTTSSTGAVSLWIDGKPMPGYTWPQHAPTLFYNSSTGQRDNPAFGIYNYHYSVTFPIDRDYDEVKIGGTADSIGFTP